MPSEWDRPHMRWTLRLEYVLSDRTALDAFRDWLVANSNPQPLELHFALLAYDRMSAQRNVQTADLARSIYQKYISLRTSTCCFNFIPHKIRQEVGASLKATGSGFPDPRLFSSILPYVDSFLRQQHEQFVCSEEFLEAFNRVSANSHPDFIRCTCFPYGFSSSLEKMYASTSMPRPYVCHATTSQNDSAVSSSFSSDRKSDNFRDPGRKIFAGVLCKKLNRLKARRERNDETERQLRDIESRKCTVTVDILLLQTAHVVTCDDDDDVECYLERMREDSLKTSANRSPCHNAVSPSRRIFCTDKGEILFHGLGYLSGNQTAPIYDSSGVESMAPSAFSDTSVIAPMLATPRRTRRSVPSGQLMTISYKGTDGVPVVAHVPASVRGITLKEFRRHFSISSHANVQFFFKSTCEDGSAPYQLLLVDEDSAYLPVFEGKITAELKRMSPE
uniref:Regulator of G protein signaling domain protein n=1 Tax=Angiostrongylus cantonensis TaxID=6313 RepID=A0A0K0CV89_ANGCA